MIAGHTAPPSLGRLPVGNTLFQVFLEPQVLRLVDDHQGLLGEVLAEALHRGLRLRVPVSLYFNPLMVSVGVVDAEVREVGPGPAPYPLEPETLGLVSPA